MSVRNTDRPNMNMSMDKENITYKATSQVSVFPCVAERSRRDRGEIAARYGKPRRPKTRRDLAAILAEMREISAAKNTVKRRKRSEYTCGKYNSAALPHVT